MDFSARTELLHRIADTVRSGGDININQNGELELRSASFAEQLFRKISAFTGIQSENKFKISQGALTQVSSLVSKVAADLGTANTQVHQDFRDVKTHLAHVYFGHSQIHPWTELLMGMPPSSSITLTSFAQSHQNLIQNSIGIGKQPKFREVDPLLHRQCAELFVKLVERAIKEGEEGRYHVEYSLLLLSEQFMSNYYKVVMDPNMPSDALNRELKAMSHSTMHDCENVLKMSNSFYTILGSLDITSEAAHWEASKHVEAARNLAMQEPMILLFGVLESLTTIESNTIKEALDRLYVLPQQLPNIDRIRVELVSALRLQALSDIKFTPKNLNNTWSKRILIQLLINRIQYFEGQANYHHMRVASHHRDLEIKVENLENHIAAAESICKELSALLPNVHASKNLESAQKNVKKLMIELQEAKEQFDIFLLRLKDKNIDPAAIYRPPLEGLPIETTQLIEKLTDQNLLFSSDIELDQQVDDLKKAHRFLKQRVTDLEEVLVDPLATMFD